jgi:hypothetical protein
MSSSSLRSAAFSFEGSGVTPSAHGRSSPAPGSVEDLERIIAELLPTGIPTDLMSRRGKEAHRVWGELAATPLYEALTIWVMAAWPEQMLDRVDTMVRTAIAAGHQVREGRWSTRRLIGVVGKAGLRPEHREVHRHLGRSVSFVSYDAVELEIVDDPPDSQPVASSVGRGVVAHLCLSLGEHRYMVTPEAASRLDRYTDIAVDHLNSVQAKSISSERPQGLCGLALFAAARPTRGANKSNRITDVFGDLPRPTKLALSRLLLGTDRRPEAALLWRHISGLSPLDVPSDIVADWRADLPDLCPAVLAFSDRRRRRTRDRSRKGDDLRQVFELAATSDVGRPEHAIAI